MRNAGKIDEKSLPEACSLRGEDTLRGNVPPAGGHAFLDAQKSMEKRRTKEGCFRAPLWKHPADGRILRRNFNALPRCRPRTRFAGAAAEKI